MALQNIFSSPVLLCPFTLQTLANVMFATRHSCVAVNCGRNYQILSEKYVIFSRLKAGLSEEKLSLMPCLRTLSNVFLNALCSKSKQIKIVLTCLT